MKEWRIPVTWEECSVIKVEANTLKEAMEIAYDEKGEIPLPSDGNYVDGSWVLTETGEVVPYYEYNWDDQSLWKNSYRWTAKDDMLETQESNLGREIYYEKGGVDND